MFQPEASLHLLPPQQLSDCHDTSQANGACIGFGNDALLAFYQGHCIHFSYHEASNLPIAKLAPGIACYQAFQCSITNSSNTESHHIDNLSPTSCQLLHLHHCLGHKGFTELQKSAAKGINGIPGDVVNCLVPMCHVCQYGAAKKCAHKTSNTGSLVGTSLGPSDCRQPWIHSFHSRQPSNHCYKSVMMWVNHFLRFLHVHCQEEATIKSTLESKEDFEMFAIYKARLV